MSPSAAAPGGDVLVVDKNAGPYFTLGSAIAAAADGDTLLLKDGVHNGAVIDGKSLVLTAEPDGKVTVSQNLHVRNLAADQTVVLHGVKIITQAPWYFSLKGTDNDGTLWLDDCRFVNSPFIAGPNPPPLHPVVELQSCARVVFNRCVIKGAPGTSGQLPGVIDSTAGVEAVDSTLVFYDLSLIHI